MYSCVLQQRRVAVSRVRGEGAFGFAAGVRPTLESVNLILPQRQAHGHTCSSPVRSSVGQEPRRQALQVYSSNTNSLSLQGVQVQQQLTSPLRITWRHAHTFKGLKAPAACSVANLTLFRPVDQGKEHRLTRGPKGLLKKKNQCVLYVLASLISKALIKKRLQEL